jgi:hypothetical protein
MVNWVSAETRWRFRRERRHGGLRSPVEFRNAATGIASAVCSTCETRYPAAWHWIKISAREKCNADGWVGRLRRALRLFLFAGLGDQIALVAKLLDHVDLRFEPVDVTLFILQQANKEIAGAVIPVLDRDSNRLIV